MDIQLTVTEPISNWDPVGSYMHICIGRRPISACTSEPHRNSELNRLHFGSTSVGTYIFGPTQRSQIFNIKPVWGLLAALRVICRMKPVIRSSRDTWCRWKFSFSELCNITANKRKESQHQKHEACLCLRKQNIWNGRVPILKSEEAESNGLKQRWVVLSDLKLWVNCGCVYMSDNIRVSPSVTLNWESEHVTVKHF